MKLTDAMGKLDAFAFARDMAREQSAAVTSWEKFCAEQHKKAKAAMDEKFGTPEKQRDELLRICNQFIKEFQPRTLVGVELKTYAEFVKTVRGITSVLQESGGVNED